MVESKLNNGLDDEQFEQPRNTAMRETFKAKYGATKTENDPNPDIVFVCRKCEHNLFVAKKDLKKIWDIPNIDCSSCGEGGERNWIIDREGNFYKEYFKMMEVKKTKKG